MSSQLSDTVLEPRDALVPTFQEIPRTTGHVAQLRIDVSTFPHHSINGGNYPPCTLENVEHLLISYGISCRYNVISKRTEIIIPADSGTYDNSEAVAFAKVISLAVLNGIATAHLAEFVGAIADANQYNPVSTWIMSKPWDRIDRLPTFFDTIEARSDFPVLLKETLIRRWLLSAVAAVLKPNGFHSRGVLTLQGQQSIGKTSWIRRLAPNDGFAHNFIKIDHHIDASNKDSVLTAIAHWIVEIGELDSSFKKDTARLKGFITAPEDKIRKPYAKEDSFFPRRTVFCATVNDAKFLVDQTGNSRWWTIPVIKLDHAHKIDMQQVFAQTAVLYTNGEQWWLTQEEEAMLAEKNSQHRVVNAIHERLSEVIDLDRVPDSNAPYFSPTALLRKIGIMHPTNPQCRDCGAFLRMHIGDPSRVQGAEKWRVPLRPELGELMSFSRAKDAFAIVHNDDDF